MAVVMLTARSEEIDTLMGLDNGTDDSLTKPFRPRGLRARVATMLRRPRSAPGAATAQSPESTSAPAAPGDGAAQGDASDAGTFVAASPAQSAPRRPEGVAGITAPTAAGSVMRAGAGLTGGTTTLMGYLREE